MSTATIFEDLFEVTKLNPDGKKFDRCDRVISTGEAYEIELFLDVASELYQLRVGDKFSMTLTSTLNPDGTPDSDEYSPDYKVIYYMLTLDLQALCTM
jgi:DNA-directed RNA polymerase I, II, and III subunit RPABC3